MIVNIMFVKYCERYGIFTEFVNKYIGNLFKNVDISYPYGQDSRQISYTLGKSNSRCKDEIRINEDAFANDI